MSKKSLTTFKKVKKSHEKIHKKSKKVTQSQNKNRKDATKNFPTIRIENAIFRKKKSRNKGIPHCFKKNENVNKSLMNKTQLRIQNLLSESL